MMIKRSATHLLVLSALVIVSWPIEEAQAFTAMVPGSHQSIRQPFALSMARRRSDDSRESYLRRLKEAASDPRKFELFVMQQVDDDIEPVSPSKESEVNEGSTKRKRYQRIEEWDAQRSADNLSWGQKVQFDGQLYGNRFRQNEILRKNLKGF
jgi:hypothetical protein